VTQPDPTELAKLIVSNFIERRDVKAVQTPAGAYMPDREDMRDTNSPAIPWSLSDVVDHIEGRKTYGHYVVSTEGTCRCIVFDLDLRQRAKPERGEAPIVFDGEEIDPREVWHGADSPAKRDLAIQLLTLADGFARKGKQAGFKTIVAYSGNKGMHTYVCLERGTSAADARDAANMIIASMHNIVHERGDNFFRHEFAFPAVSIEVFPKQDSVKADGFGNLVRLPLGVNQKTGKRGFFLDITDGVQSFKIDDPMLALSKGSLR
jgi:hypothetical protein